MIAAADRDLGRPLAAHLRDRYAGQHVFVIIPEVQPDRRWERLLRNNRCAVLERAVRRHSDAIVCRMRFPVPARSAGSTAPSEPLVAGSTSVR